MLILSTHNICFHGEIKKLLNSFWLKHVPYLELRYNKTFCDKTGKKSVFRITAFRIHTLNNLSIFFIFKS